MQSDPHKAEIAVIGECLIELYGEEFGVLHQTFGGDTLNTALYLARLTRGAALTRYVTVVGEDSLSDGLVERWRGEGIDVSLTLRDAGRLPGLYQIQVDSMGERSFLYWRSDSAARYLLQHPGFERVRDALASVDLIYLSAITLAMLPSLDRARLLELLSSLSRRGIAIAFDTNYRPRLWDAAPSARAAITALLSISRLVFATFDDEQRLWGDATPDATLRRMAAAKAETIVVKLGAAGCWFADEGVVVPVPTTPVDRVVDTTAAGDAFNAAYLAARLAGLAAIDCCQAGNALAGIVIQHRGAIMPAAGMPTLQALLRERQPASSS